MGGPVLAMFKAAAAAVHTVKANAQSNQIDAVNTVKKQFEGVINAKLPATYAFSYAVISAHGKKITDFAFLSPLLLAQLKSSVSANFNLSQLDDNNTVENAMVVTKAVLAFVKANEDNIRTRFIPDISIQMSHELNPAQQKELTDALKDISVTVNVRGKNFNLTNPAKHTYVKSTAQSNLVQAADNESTPILSRQDSGNNELVDKRSSTGSLSGYKFG